MKKNNMFRIASVLLVAVLLSTCAISGAFAKYTTSGEATDSARVAKFGITVTGAGEGIFTETYASDDSAAYVGNTVISTVDVVAPGTEGKFVSFTYEGNAEVATEVRYAIDLNLKTKDGESEVDCWKVNGSYYCPIVITIGNESVSGLTCDSIAAFEAAVEAKAESLTKQFAPGETPSDADDFEISWSWDFDDNGAGTNDAKDTALGLLLNDSDATNDPTITLTVTATINQLD